MKMKVKKFGKRSMANLKTCHKDLRLILTLALRWSRVDFSVIEGHRSTRRQNNLYKAGKSKIDGIKRKGKHNKKPSEAADIMIYHNDRDLRKMIAWDMRHFAYLAGIIEAAARHLYSEGKISHLVRWGGNWNKDGVILLDQTFDDGPHFEIYEP